jgi:hypothetical protein
MTYLDSWTVDLLGKDVYADGVKILPRIKGINFVGASSVELDEASGYVTVTVGGSGSHLYPELEVASSRSAALTDTGFTLGFNNASPMTFTVEPDSTVNFQNGSIIKLYQKGTGQLTIAEGSGVVVRSSQTRKLREQYAPGELIKLATNTWLLAGDLELT